MDKKRNKGLIKIYTGPETSSILLKARLEELGVFTLTKNDFSGAYMGVIQPSVDLWIYEDDLQKTKPVLDDFLLNHQSESNEI